MQLDFERTAEDLIAFNLHHLQRSPVARRNQLGWRVLTTLLAVMVPVVPVLLPPRGSIHWIVVAGAALTSGVVIFFAFPWLMRWSTVRTLRRMLKERSNDAIFGPQHLQLLPEGILGSNRSGEQRLSWSAVQDVTQDETHFFLYISALSALVIPKSCFKSEDEKHEFLQLVEKYRAAQREG